MNAVREYHTSELTAACPRRAFLTREGQAFGYTTGALYIGNVCHAALRWLHEQDRWDQAATMAAVVHGAAVAAKQADADSRPMSPAVKANQTDHNAEALQIVNAYAARMRPGTDWKLIGCELPIRFTLEHDDLDEPAEFASHLDLLCRESGRLVLPDWKSGTDAPTDTFLSRNLQMGLYWLAVKYGEVKVGADWIAFDEWPEVRWIHLRALLPYGRAGKCVDDNGEEVAYSKGDPRPLRMAVRPVQFDPAMEAALRDELALRVRMDRAGMHPTNPDPTGCLLCEAKAACSSFDGYSGSFEQ